VERALRVRRCADCRQVFFADRPDQKYCDHACANRTASRQYRKRHARQRALKTREVYGAKVRQRLRLTPEARVSTKQGPRKYQ
jgi:hypothetical protein